MDIFLKEGILSIVLSIWAFTSPLIAIVKKRKEIINATCGVQVIEEPGSRTELDNRANIICCPCIAPCVLTEFMAEWDDPALAIALSDYLIISKTLTLKQTIEQQRIEGVQLQDLNSALDLEQNSERTSISENLINASSLPSSPFKLFYKLGKENISIPLRIIKGSIGLVAVPTLVNYFVEANGNQIKIARLFTLGAPIFQEFGINVLSFLNYLSFIPALSINSSKFVEHVNKKIFTFLYICWGLGSVITSYYYTSKLENPIAKLFLISVMTIRTFGVFDIACQCCCVGTNCCGINVVKFFFAGINLWYAIQNTIWALKGTNVLDPNVNLWKPF